MYTERLFPPRRLPARTCVGELQGSTLYEHPQFSNGRHYFGVIWGTEIGCHLVEQMQEPLQVRNHHFERKFEHRSLVASMQKRM